MPRHCLQASRSSHLHQPTPRFRHPHDQVRSGMPPLDPFLKACMHLRPLSGLLLLPRPCGTYLYDRPQCSRSLSGLRVLLALRPLYLQWKGLSRLPKQLRPFWSHSRLVDPCFRILAYLACDSLENAVSKRSSVSR